MSESPDLPRYEGHSGTYTTATTSISGSMGGTSSSASVYRDNTEDTSLPLPYAGEGTHAYDVDRRASSSQRGYTSEHTRYSSSSATDHPQPQHQHGARPPRHTDRMEFRPRHHQPHASGYRRERSPSPYFLQESLAPHAPIESGYNAPPPPPSRGADHHPAPYYHHGHPQNQHQSNAYYHHHHHQQQQQQQHGGRGRMPPAPYSHYQDREQSMYREHPDAYAPPPSPPYYGGAGSQFHHEPAYDHGYTGPPPSRGPPPPAAHRNSPYQQHQQHHGHHGHYQQPARPQYDTEEDPVPVSYRSSHYQARGNVRAEEGSEYRHRRTTDYEYHHRASTAASTAILLSGGSPVPPPPPPPSSAAAAAAAAALTTEETSTPRASQYQQQQPQPRSQRFEQRVPSADEEPRKTGLYIYGLEAVSAEAVLDYWRHLKPVAIEWINSSSGIVLFEREEDVIEALETQSEQRQAGQPEDASEHYICHVLKNDWVARVASMQDNQGKNPISFSNRGPYDAHRNRPFHNGSGNHRYQYHHNEHRRPPRPHHHHHHYNNQHQHHGAAGGYPACASSSSYDYPPPSSRGYHPSQQQQQYNDRSSSAMPPYNTKDYPAKHDRGHYGSHPSYTSQRHDPVARNLDDDLDRYMKNGPAQPQS